MAHRQITCESPAGIGEIPNRALALKRSSVICDGALQAEASVATKCEGHGNLAERHILGRKGATVQGGVVQ